MMSLCAKILQLGRCPSTMLRKFSVAAQATHIADDPIQIFRTNETNPVNHTTDHIARYYTVPPDIQNVLFSHGGLPKPFRQQAESFLELSILVRSPVVELISYLEQTDYTRPVNKYVLYGELGTGKSISMAHVIHYAAASKKIIVHVPWAAYWFKFPKEVATSTTKEGLFDLPMDAAAWLVHFKHQNNQLLSELDLRLSKDYTWSSRETTKAGAPLMELIDLGLSRVKFACDIIYALTDELKIASTNGKCKTLVAIDGFNAFFGKTSKIKNDDKKYIKPIQVSLSEAFLNMTKYDWCNGAIVVSVDPLATMTVEESFFPKYLLGKQGFEHLDPFLPIKLENYTLEEFDSVIEYYKERKWLRDLTKSGQRELELLTAKNPYNLMLRTMSI